MRKSALFSLLFFSVWAPCLGWEVSSRVGGVEILASPLLDEEGLCIGADLFASNQNEHAVYLVIELSSAENVVDGLRPGPIRLRTFDQLYLGWIVRESPDRGWSASYRAAVSTPESRTVESYYWFWY